MLDFREAPSQDGQASRTFAEIAAALLARAPDVVRHLIPRGRQNGNEYVTGNLHGDRGASLSINTKTGVFKDFASGEGGGDLISLWGAVRGIQNGEAKAEAESWLGIAPPAPRPVKAQPEERDDGWWKTVRPSKVWKYIDAAGRHVASVYRFDRAGEKVIRPWNELTGRWEAPESGRPIYGLPSIQSAPAAKPIVLVEGEKCADAVAAAGYLATCIMGGAQAAGKTDWTALSGRHVVVWPDNDPAGDAFAKSAEARLREAKVASFKRLPVPAGKPPKWDAADASPEERRALLEAALAAPAVFETAPPFDPDAWTLEPYGGPPPERRFLVAETLPIGKAGVFAAMGDTGKGMMMLDLALKVAGGQPGDEKSSDPPRALGGRVLAFGTAVILSAEDDQEEFHHRLHGLDPDAKRRRAAGRRLRIIPFPNAGGVLPFFQAQHEIVRVTERLDVIARWLRRLPDLRLVVVDPIASFAAAPIDKDNAAGAYIMGVLSQIAAETGACLLVAHHVRKDEKEITSVAQARASIRGASALVDNGRFAYVLWPAPSTVRARAAAALGVEDEPARFVQGAIVKSNGPADRTVRLYVRNAKNGLLEDRTNDERNAARTQEDTLLWALQNDVRAAAADPARKPLMIGSDRHGLMARRAELTECLHGLGRERMKALAETAIEKGMIVQRPDKFLDVPA